MSQSMGAHTCRHTFLLSIMFQMHPNAQLEMNRTYGNQKNAVLSIVSQMRRSS